jgi:hypothetical protein
VRQEVSQPTIVGQNQEALAIHVETSNWKNPDGGGHKVQHRRSSLRVISGGDDAGRFVQDEIHQVRRGGHQFSVYANFGLVGVDSIAEFRDATVDRYATFSDENFTGSSTSEPRTCEGFLQPLTFGDA